MLKRPPGCPVVANASLSLCGSRIGSRRRMPSKASSGLIKFARHRLAFSRRKRCPRRSGPAFNNTSSRINGRYQALRTAHRRCAPFRCFGCGSFRYRTADRPIPQTGTQVPGADLGTQRPVQDSGIRHRCMRTGLPFVVTSPRSAPAKFWRRATEMPRHRGGVRPGTINSCKATSMVRKLSLISRRALLAGVPG